jgi:hypothetical protein
MLSILLLFLTLLFVGRPDTAMKYASRKVRYNGTGCAVYVRWHLLSAPMMLPFSSNSSAYALSLEGIYEVMFYENAQSMK